MGEPDYWKRMARRRLSRRRLLTGAAGLGAGLAAASLVGCGLGNRRMTPWFGDWYLYPPNLWIDTAHPTFQGRSA
jgi:hypothetical protein